MNEPVFSPELLDMIVDEWNLSQQYEEIDPLDGDEVDLLVKYLAREINIHQGNTPQKEITFRTDGIRGTIIVLFVGFVFVHGFVDLVSRLL